MQWRNWRLLVKLAAVLVVPALLAVGLGVVQIHGDVTRANFYADMQRLVKMRGELRTLLEALQMERTMSVERLSGDAAVDPSDLRQQKRGVDSAQAAVTSTRKQEVSLAGVAANRYRDAVGLLAHLPALRAQVASGNIGSWTALNDYGTIITGLLTLDQALVSRFATPQLTRAATALYDLEAVEEQIHLEHAILLQAADRGRPMTPTLIKALQEADIRLRDRLGDFRAVATPAELSDYQRTVTGPAVSRRAHVVSAMLAGPPASGAQQNATRSLPVSVDSWNRESETTGTLVDKAADGFLHTLRTTSAKLQDQTSNQAGVASVILFAVLLLALAIGLAIGRHLLWSLTVLRSTALDVAEHRLPATVVSMREGRKAFAMVDVVPVHTTEEFGQLARAFDTVHSQAVRLAAEQAALRGDLRNTLVNLSRRSQSLVDRLLLLMEQLERHEEDPEQLASLFTLDHLATRMRRNNENMMVLCGSTLVRSSHSAALDTVLRGAVSEIERYQRVLVQPSRPVEVIGYAAGDLGRLVAELLDNATAFSPPHTKVLMGGTRQPDGSLLIEIQDEGIGMSESDLARANRHVATDAATDAPASRQLGLFVVGRLAGRHGIAVNLSSQPGVRGLRARVLVPAKLVTAQAPAHTDQPGTMAERLAVTLPTRTRGGRTDGGNAASRPPQRPFAVAAVTTRPDPADKDAPRKPTDPSWFPLAASASASATAPAAPSAGNSVDTPVPRAATEEPAPVPSSSTEAPDAPEPTGRPAPAPAVRRPAGRSAQEPDQSADLTQAGLPKRVPRTRSAPARAERSATGDGAAASPNANRAHSFLSSYQSGIRRAQPDQTHNPSATGRKNP
ncbi:sensor histidine kinase [Streptomyces mirabilis]|uniref:sensor histidine kinase n=1 Tax=Streptomyces mirabilis TaxID=68239 RepID=UPI00225A7494|nr:nitrate- and nitrite sensing domain-containing protein [Streptomyces mirabilis]MCX4428381.1 nitrate- and nitrite sensing domain-containing protein [Streptomyces mirabilis]